MTMKTETTDNNLKLLQAMTALAVKLHDEMCKQTRKYTGEAYSTHPIAVEQHYARYYPDDYAGRGACLGHDFFEDTPASILMILEFLQAYGVRIDRTVGEMIGLMWELTEVYTKEAFPDLSRRERKRLETIRIGNISTRAKNIKLCDLVHNTQSIVQHDAEFAKVYLGEKTDILGMAIGPNSGVCGQLWEEAKGSISDGYALLRQQRALQAPAKL